MTNFRKKREYYSLEFKQKVLEPILKGEMSAYEARKQYGLKGSMTVYRWLDKVESIMGSKFEVESFKLNSPIMEKKDLQAENEALRKMLELERLKSEAYLTMIKLAEQKFSISIEKKSGTKQS